MDTPFFGGTYVSRSSNLADNVCMNLYPEVVQTKDGKVIGGFFSTPGLRSWLAIGNGPIRGLAVASGQNKLVVVSGKTVYTIDQNGGQVTLGNLTTSVGPVDILTNGTQVFVADGLSGWVYSAGAWTQTTLTRPMVACQQDGFGLVNQYGTNQFYQSNLNDFTVWDGLNFSSADSEPSPIVGIIDLFRQVWIFKQESTEIWNNVGANGFAFQRMQGAFLETGCAARYSVATGGQQILWLGNDERGGNVVYSTQGYQASRISTHAEEYAIGQCSRVDDAVGFVYQQEGHTFYVLTFPSGNITLVYDISLGLWHLRGEYANGAYSMHDGFCHAYWQGLNLVGSASQGVIYQYDLGYPTDDLAGTSPSNPKRWLRRWRALKTPMTVPVRFPALQIDMQTGSTVGGASDTGEILTITGALGNQYVGQPVHFAYTVTSTVRLVGVTITAGSLPLGLSMDSTGLVTGTPTTTGTYSWTVTATNVLGDQASDPDGCTVAMQMKGLFALMSTASGSNIWFSQNPASFPYAGTLQNALAPLIGNSQMIAFDGSEMLYVGGASHNQISNTSNQTVSNGVSLSNILSAATFASASVVSVGGVLFQYVVGGSSYAYSTDHGGTWTTVACPSSFGIYQIVRLANGTWCGIFIYGSTQTVQYSTQSVPTTWSVGLSGMTGSLSGSLATDGTTVVTTNNSGQTYTSADGIHWTTINNSAPGEAASYIGAFNIRGGTLGNFVASLIGGGGTSVEMYYSKDSGATWNTGPSFSVAAGSILNTTYGNGYFLVNIASDLFYTSDGGVSWQSSTLPSGATGQLLASYL